MRKPARSPERLKSTTLESEISLRSIHHLTERSSPDRVDCLSTHRGLAQAQGLCITVTATSMKESEAVERIARTAPTFLCPLKFKI